ncbi:MAG: short-chain fatty acid transporter [Desulfomonilaceae bacterium]
MTQQKDRTSFEFLKDWGDGLTRWSERWIPDALVIVWILSFIAFALALLFGNATPKQAVIAWGKGFWVLLEFGMQMCLIMMTGYILACSPPVKRILNALSSLPNPDKPWQAIMAMSLFSMISAWLNWGLSLIASAMFALFLVRRNPKTDYRLLVAAAYLGLGCTWHSGLSGSAPLLVNTPNNFLIQGKYLDSTIPTSETIFSGFNLVMALIVIVVITALMCLMHPTKEKTYQIKPELLDQLKLYQAPDRPTGKLSISEWLNWWPGFNIIVALGGLLWLGWDVGQNGFRSSINLNNINFFFLMLGVLFHWRPWAFLKAAEDAGKAVWGVIIQFPFYAGIFGLFKFTALGAAIAKAFVVISTPSTFLLILYWYSGIENYLVPSGGSKFAITAPFIIPAAKELGVSIPKTVLTYAWGDMMTDMIQPFWAIAMLAIAKLQFREIMGWLMLVFFVYFVITSIAFLIYPMI